MNRQKHVKRVTLGIFSVLILAPLLYELVQYPLISDVLILSMGVFIVISILYSAFQLEGAARNKFLVFMLLLLAAQVYWIIYQLAPMRLTFLVHYNVDRHVFGILITQDSATHIIGEVSGVVKSSNSVLLFISDAKCPIQI